MEEAAERRKRLKALRDEVQEPQKEYEGLVTSNHSYAGEQYHNFTI